MNNILVSLIKFIPYSFLEIYNFTFIDGIVDICSNDIMLLKVMALKMRNNKEISNCYAYIYNTLVYINNHNNIDNNSMIIFYNCILKIRNIYGDLYLFIIDDILSQMRRYFLDNGIFLDPNLSPNINEFNNLITQMKRERCIHENQIIKDYNDTIAKTKQIFKNNIVNNKIAIEKYIEEFPLTNRDTIKILTINKLKSNKYSVKGKRMLILQDNIYLKILKLIKFNSNTTLFIDRYNNRYYINNNSHVVVSL